MKRSAIFSDCRTWRYTLERYWEVDLFSSDERFALFVLLNPSTADELNDDPTNRRGISFAKRLGFSGVVFCNLFAFRTPYPVELKEASAPVGPDNAKYLREFAERAGRIIVAWGADGGYKSRGIEVLELLNGFDLWCFGRTANGSPKHILYLPGNAELEIYQTRGE